jgi:glycosyltransferase involved in cell wall biosynthesis
MSSRPLVSVIVIFFNTEKFVQEAIDSVFAQTYDKWDLLLVDDGSTDGSTRIALQYAEQFPEKVRYLEHVEHQNRGASASRNLGISHAKGDILAFLDSDDVWLPHKLQEQVAILDLHPEATILYGNTQYWYSWTGNATDSQRDSVPELVVQTDTLVKPPMLLTGNYPLGEGTAPSFSNLVLRREVIDRVGGFEERFKRVYTDQAFVVKAYVTEPVFVASERQYWDRYRQHPDSAVSVMWGTGQYWSVRQDFLDWFEEYLSKEEVKNPEVWQLLREAQLEVYKRRLRNERHKVQRLRRRIRVLEQRVQRLRSASTNRAKRPNLGVVNETRPHPSQSTKETVMGKLSKRVGHLRARLLGR